MLLYASNVWDRRSERRRLYALSAGAGLVFLVFCLFRVRHSYDYDESVTVGFFVRQSSFLDAITSQRVFNNHPLLTAINWVVYHLGGDSEAWQRLAPVSAGVASVVILVGWCARRWGLYAGAAAALATAANPLLVTLSSQARGYSFAALAAVISTILVLDKSSSTTARRIDVAYAVTVALGLLGHLYVGIVFAGHAGILITRRDIPSARIWFRSTVAGSLGAALGYAPLLARMVEAARARDGAFVAEFPLQVADAMFGQRWVAAVAAGILLALCVSSRPVRVFAAITVGFVSVVWVVVQPFDLYPRFLVWSIPLFGLAAAALVARDRRWLLPVLVIGIASASATVDQRQAEADIRLVANAARTYEQQQNLDVCVADFSWESYVAYAVFEPVNDRRRCDVVIVRSSDLDNPTVADRSFASIPGSTGTCLAASKTVLRSVGRQPGSCDH